MILLILKIKNNYMSISSFNNIKIVGIAGTVPKLIVNNLNDHPKVNTEEKKKTIQLTGISEYRKSTREVCTSDLCKKSAETLFSEMNINPDSIDAIIFVTQTPDYKLPSTACIMQDKLGCKTSTIAFDISLACSGFIYGLFTACSFITGGGIKRVLLLCGDTQTKLYHSEDKNVSFLLGDAGTATIIDYYKNSEPISITLRTDGSGYDTMIVPAGGFRKPSNEFTGKIVKNKDGDIRSEEHLHMKGIEVFKFAATTVFETIKSFMDEIKISNNEIDYLFLHQANKFMTDKIAQKLNIPKEKVPYSLEYFGNTSSASIPLTIANYFSNYSKSFTKRCILSGFGNGLSWGVADVKFKNTYCLPIQEI